MKLSQINQPVLKEHCGVCDYEERGWYQSLKDEEKKMIHSLVHDDWSKGNPSMQRRGLKIIEFLNTLDQLMPFKGDRLGISDWLDKAQELEIITPNEKSQVINFCIEFLSF
jgi:hypothetical protein